MDKKSTLIIGIIAIALILALRMFFLQIVYDEYKLRAEKNALLYETKYPARGEILDRNRKTLVGNKITYDIMATPIDIKEFDTLDFCNIFNVDIEAVKKKLENWRINRKKIGYQSFTFIKQVSDKQYSLFAEKAYMFPGFYAVSRTWRIYPFNAGANLFGYINEVDKDYLDKHPDYRSGDYAGITGIEKSYEDILRGKKGYNVYVRDVHNRVRSSYMDGALDVDAVPGGDLISSIDGELQQYGELLMSNKVGSIVAIEPSTGEILAIVSSPCMTIDQLANIRREYSNILKDPYKPMFNRAVMSAYPPGSVFKTVQALIAQQRGVITEETRFGCALGFHYGTKGRLGCHGHPSPLNLKQSIMMSCNAYYANTFRAILNDKRYDNIYDAFDAWKRDVNKFGFGVALGSDFPSELAGNLPSTQTYDRIHGKGRWNSYNILSLSIGQGEVGATPLQIANLAAIIANKGYWIPPHLIKISSDSLKTQKYSTKNYVDIDEKYFAPVIEGMYLAVNAPAGAGGTARRAYLEGVQICGKTGTAQNPHGKDHSVFMCFAPRENPQIALSVYVENAGAGGVWAATIASLMVEKYLNGEVKRKELEQSVINTNLKQNVPIRKRR